MEDMTLPPWRDKRKTGMPTEGLFIFVGLQKVGKTSLGASIPDSIIIELEKGGADRVSGRIAEVSTLPDFKGVLKAAVAAPEIKCVVIDTLDAVASLIEDDVARAAGLDNILERKQGVDSWGIFAELRKRIEGLVGYFKASGKLIVLLAHTKEPKLDANGVVVVPQGLNVMGRGASVIAAAADGIGHVYKKQITGTTKYFVSFSGGPLGVFGSRIPELEDKTVELPRTNQWTAIQALFKSEAAPAKPSSHSETKSSTKPQGGTKR
jgi:hypothetical protein